MNTQSNALPDDPLDAKAIAPTALSPTRPLYWSVRRELWENRSIYVAPLAVAAIYFLGYLISLFWVPRSMHGMGVDESTPPIVALAMPYSHAAMLIMLIAFIVGIFYSLEALHGERRDRSILFWKSLPVSDLTTVLAKAIVPLVILPVLIFAITVSLQIIMKAIGSAVLLISRPSTATPWGPPLMEMDLVLLYSVIVMVLWHAPLYMWMLLVSGAVRRATFLWAVLPPLAIAGVEKIAFNSSYFGYMLLNRLFGFVGAFDLTDRNGVAIDPHFIPLEQLNPGKFLSNPALWLGLIFAAIFFVAAVRVRRYQGAL